MARERGFKGIVAVRGDEGVALAHEYRPDAIILDMGLPVQDGWQVLEHLKRHPETRHIPVHIVSGGVQNGGVQDALRAGAVAVLEKPVEHSVLDEQYGKILEFVERGTRRLLIVDDDDAQRQAIVELIGSGDDVEITAVGSSEEALEALDSDTQFDCMVLDLKLPKMSGFQLLEKVKTDERFRGLPVIVYTGRDLTRREETRLNKYAETVIVKDVRSPERLLDETALFLHRVESKLPAEKRRILEQLHSTDEVFKGKRVLIADDDMRNVFALAAVLERQGMDVQFAENGNEAIASLEADPSIDLVLMDIMMPELDGYEAMQRIRQVPKFAKLPIISLTAKAMKGDREKSIASGASDYITKPVDTDQLLSLDAGVAVQVGDPQHETPEGRLDLETLELQLLLEGVYRQYGYDFREYAVASLRRRVWRRVHAEGAETIAGLLERLLHDPSVMERLLLDLSINVTSMFRDPTFYGAFREKVVPLLRTYPFTRIWVAGCSTGEEVYSLAIMLTEEGLYGRSRIYATDINEAVLARAREGVFPLDRMQEYTDNYIRAGGKRSFSEYYLAKYEGALFERTLTENVVWAPHNLVQDRLFNTFNVILCRNVMIYFDRPLQNRVHQLFHDSLERFGILALGHKESIRFTGFEDSYEELDAYEKLYRRIR